MSKSTNDLWPDLQFWQDPPALSLLKRNRLASHYPEDITLKGLCGGDGATSLTAEKS